VRAVEQGITDTQYRMNSGMTPIEAGLGEMIDLDGAEFVGREALRAARDAGPTRRTIGLVVEGYPVPRLDDFWPLLDGSGGQVGVARWAVWSYALETSIAIALVDATVAADEPLTLRTPDGDRSTRPHAIPFV
jgi:aminomethyltransferase